MVYLSHIRQIIISCRVFPASHLIKMCKVAGIPVDERPFTVAEMMDADEVIVSSSSNFCLSAHEIDEKPVGGKAPEILATLRKLLMDEYLTAIGRK